MTELGEGVVAALGVQGANFTLDTGKNPKDYAFAAIQATQRQFHDAHEDYSNFVLRELNLLAKKLEKTHDLWCPDAKKEGKDKGKTQMLMLVTRLNTMSRRLKAFVENPGPKWRENLVTSRFSLDFIRERILKGVV